jgi:hypothetical protein
MASRDRLKSDRSSGAVPPLASRRWLSPSNPRRKEIGCVGTLGPIQAALYVRGTSELGKTILGARHRQEAIGVTTPCTRRKSHPKSSPPLGSEKTSELGRTIRWLVQARSRRSISPRPGRARVRRVAHVWTDPDCPLCKRNKRACKDHLSWEKKELATYRTRSQWRDVARRPNRTAVPRGDTPRPRCRRCPSPGEAPYPMASTDSCA